MTINFSDVPTLIKPFQGQVQSNGIAVVTISQNNQGLSWIVYQIGFALGQQAPAPQVAAHYNSIPLVASVAMQLSAFASIPTAAPYAMETFFYGPPYVNLNAGDQLVCAVIGANSGDQFTIGVYVNEVVSPTAVSQAQNYGWTS